MLPIVWFLNLYSLEDRIMKGKANIFFDQKTVPGNPGHGKEGPVLLHLHQKKLYSQA